MKRIVYIILALAMLVSFAACGGKTAGEEGAAATYGDAGSYEIFSIVDGDSTLDRTALLHAGLPMMMTLEDGGKGTLDFGDGDSAALTWTDRSITLDGETLGYRLDDGLLVMDLSDSEGVYILTFQPASAETAAAAPTGEEKGAADPKAAEPTTAPEPSEEPSSAPAPEQTPKPIIATAPDQISTELPITADLGEYHVVILGADQIRDADEGDIIRIFYEFTNNSDVPTAAYTPLYLSATQDGEDLETAYSTGDDDLPEYWNELLNVEPGVTIRCIEQYIFDPDGGTVSFSISQLFEDGITVSLEPDKLPGKPAEDWSIEPIPDPGFFMDYSSEGENDDAAVKIVGAELTDISSLWSDEGDQLVRFYFEITNKTEEPTSLLLLLTITAYQDGIEMDTGFPEEETEEDLAYSEDIPAGETVTVSETWILRSENPVEVAVTEWLSDDVICAGTLDLNQ